MPVTEADLVQEWITSAEALNLVAARTGSIEEARDLLNKKAAEGAFRARANVAVNEIDLGPISKIAPQRLSPLRPFISRSQNAKTINIGEEFWTWKQKSLYDDELWKWTDGIFALVNPPIPIFKRFKGDDEYYSKPSMRHILYGVEFLRAEILEFSSSIPRTAQIVRGKRGPRVKKWNYAPVLAQLQQLVLNGTIAEKFGDLDQYGTQASIEKYLANALTLGDGTGPPEATVRRKAKDLMTIWRTYQARTE